MTESERQDIITKDFDQLWANMWIEHKSGIFINEKEKARRIFNEIDKAHIINSSGVSKYLFQEYGFPKGRKNLNETPYNCAIREFKEETGILDDCYEILSNRTLTEEFIGTDRVRYSHTYFLAEIADIILPSVDNSQEIRSVDFFTYKQSYRLFRNYDIQKKYILSKAYNLCKF
jgi:ADP-ribose pyrophosphatase YjhB (NUDIX family)